MQPSCRCNRVASEIVLRLRYLDFPSPTDHAQPYISSLFHRSSHLIRVVGQSRPTVPVSNPAKMRIPARPIACERGNGRGL